MAAKYLRQFRLYQSFVAIFQPIMLALCLMLSVTYYAQNYAGITNQLVPTHTWEHAHTNTHIFYTYVPYDTYTYAICIIHTCIQTYV